MRKKGLQTLAIITPGFPSDEQDTTCLPAHQMFVKSLNKVFPQLKIIILTLQYPYTEKEYRWYENAVVPLNGKKYPKIFRFFLWRTAYRKLKKIHRTTPIDGVLSFWYNDGALIGDYFARQIKIPHYCWITGQDAKKENTFAKWYKLPANCLIAMSDSLSDEFLQNHGIRPKYIVTNGIDESLFMSDPVKRDIDIIGAGSLIPLKQYHILIEVINRLRNNFPELNVVLCGKGPEKEKLEAQINSLGLQKNITLSGEISHIEVLKIMQRSKILLHPSSSEGYSTVCLEALYAGCHVVSFLSPEHSRIDHWHITGNIEEMTERCAAILNDKETEYTPVLPRTMKDCAHAMINIISPSA